MVYKKQTCFKCDFCYEKTTRKNKCSNLPFHRQAYSKWYYKNKSTYVNPILPEITFTFKKVKVYFD